MKFTKRFFLLSVLLILSLLVLASCNSPDLSDKLHTALDTYFSTATTAKAVTTSPAETSGTAPAPTDPEDSFHAAADAYFATEETIEQTRRDMHELLDLVYFTKAEMAEDAIEKDYVGGEFRTLLETAESGDLFRRMLELYYIEQADTAELATTVLINTYLDVLGDRYGYYLDPESFLENQSDVQGKYHGIGVQVTLTDDNYLEVLSVFAGSPAEAAGMEPGDLIVAVEGEDVAQLGYQATVNRIKGEAGTSVGITVLREGGRIDLTVGRAEVTEITVTYEMLPSSVGKIRISSFDEKTYDQFVEAYFALLEAGAESLIFDVRYNPGGLLTSVVAILEFILPDGDIVHLSYKDARQTITGIYNCGGGEAYMNEKDENGNFVREYYEDHEITLPIAVLMNGSTASAGELFTSALMDHGVATVIGESSYGKGVGQGGQYLYNNYIDVLTGKEQISVLYFTIFFYDPPTSENYNGVGITPDIPEPLSEAAQEINFYKLTLAEDNQLQRAHAWLTAE